MLGAWGVRLTWLDCKVICIKVIQYWKFSAPKSSNTSLKIIQK